MTLRRVGKVGLFIVSIFLFILAITLMKEGSRELAPLVRDNFHVDSPANSLGFGWLFAYIVMSGSPVAAAALTFFDAGVIDKLSTFTLLTVIPNDKKQAKAESSLHQAREMIDSAESQIETRIRSGTPVKEIAAEAAAGGHDLVIIGEPERNRFINRQRAPIAEDLVTQAPCPVLIARGRPRPIRKLLFCESGHEPSLVDDLTGHMPFLVEQAEQVTVLHVMSQIAAGPGVAGWELRADAEKLIEEHTPEGLLLEEGVHQLEQLDVHPKAKVRHGLVVQEILDEAKSGDYDLLVIGAHPGHGWKHFLLRDLAREIIGRIDRPLLVIKR